MEGIKEKEPTPFVACADGRSMAIEVDTSLYEIDAVFRTAYKLTDRYYIFLARETEHPNLITTMLTAKEPGTDLGTIAGEFCNELIDQQIRRTVFRETGTVRELIVAQSFAEGNLLDPQRDDGDYKEDPLGIGQRR